MSMQFPSLNPVLTNSPTTTRRNTTSAPPPTVGSFSSRNAPRTTANLAHLGRADNSGSNNALATYQSRSRALQQSDRNVTEYTKIAHAPKPEPVQVEVPGMQFNADVTPQHAKQVDVSHLGNDVGSRIVKEALGMLGTPYAWGGGGIGVRSSRGTGKGTQNVIGVDCSGLTSYVYSKFGIKLPRHSNHQTQVGYRTNIKNARPGDIVGWAKGGHVAIYMGGGKIVESPRPGKRVRVRNLHSGDKVYAVRIIR